MSQPRLLDQMREALHLKHRSRRTAKADVGWIRWIFHARCEGPPYTVTRVRHRLRRLSGTRVPPVAERIRRSQEEVDDLTPTLGG